MNKKRNTMINVIVVIIMLAVLFAGCGKKKNADAEIGTPSDLSEETTTEESEVTEETTAEATEVELDASGNVMTQANGTPMTKAATNKSGSSGTGTTARASSGGNVASTPATQANNNYSKPATNAPTTAAPTPTAKVKVAAYRCNGCGTIFSTRGEHTAHNKATACGGCSEVWI